MNGHDTDTACAFVLFALDFRGIEFEKIKTCAQADRTGAFGLESQGQGFLEHILAFVAETRQEALLEAAAGGIATAQGTAEKIEGGQGMR